MSKIDERALEVARRSVGTIPGAALWLSVETAVKAYLSALEPQPGGVGVKGLSALLDEFASDVEALAMLEHMAGSAPSRDQVEQAKSDIANTRQRILSAPDLSPAEPVALPERCPHCNLHWGYNPPALIAGTDQVRCIECKTVYAHPTSVQMVDSVTGAMIDAGARVLEDRYGLGQPWEELCGMAEDVITAALAPS